MSKARPVFPGETILSTRKVHKRQFLLRPCKVVNQLILYVVAVLAERHGILLHALTALSNHKHDVSTDVDTHIPEFQRDCHSIISRYLNYKYGDSGSLWEAKPTSRVTCEEPGDVIDKIAYTLANPVSSFLVKHGRSWPGVRVSWPIPPMVIKRPPGFFRTEEEGGEWPDEVTLVLHRPPGCDDLDDEELAAAIAEATEKKEEEARQEAAREGIEFIGRRAILHQSRYGHPKSKRPRSGISPKVAAKSKPVRIARLRRNRSWQEDYDDCMRRFNAGERDVIFPFGTYKMRLYHGVICHPPD